MNSKSVAVAIVCLALARLGGGTAYADQILSSHAFVGARTLYGGVSSLPGSENLIVGDGRLDTGILSDSAGGPNDGVPSYSGSARAITDITADRFLKVSSSAYGAGAGSFSPVGYGQGVASWRDIAFVDSPDMPEVLRLTFRVDGTLTASQTVDVGFPSNLAQFGVSTTTNPINYFDPSQGGTDFNRNFLHEASFYLGNQSGSNDNPAPGFTTGRFQPWDSFTFSGSTFTGTFHIDTFFDPTLGGYGWGLTASARSEAAGGSAETDFLNTLSLMSVARLDGTAVEASFDSGLSFVTVPEPSSLALAGCGALALGAVAMRRRHA